MNIGTPRPIVRPPYGFPLTGILDTYNRADSLPQTTSSSGTAYNTTAPFPLAAAAGLQVTSNQCVGASPDGNAQSFTPSFGPNCEAYATIKSLFTDPSDFRLFVRAAFNGAGVFTAGYYVQMSRNQAGQPAGSCDLVLVRPGPVFLGVARVPNFQAGDGLGLSAVGSKIIVWYQPQATGVWAPYLIRTDATYAGSGLIACAVFDAVSWDNFGGGTR